MFYRLFTAIIFAVMAIAGSASTPEYDSYSKRMIHPHSANYDPDSLQTITGRFNGTDRDTLALFPLSGWEEDDGYYYNQWIVVSQNGTVPSVTVETVWPELVMEGDLDGNGTDEFGVLATGRFGCWTSYYVFTCYKSQLYKMLSPEWYACNEDLVDDIVMPDKKKGRVIVNYYNCHDVVKYGGAVPHRKTQRITKFLK